METRANEAPRKIGTIGVLGGGTAGYFAALAIKARFPDRQVTVVESSAVPIIGVGEATTTLMPPFLHAQLGLDAVEMFREVRPTFKMGIKFEWGLPGDYFFTYPFGDADPIEAHAYDADLRSQSLVSMLMAGDRSPFVRDADGAPSSLLPRVKFAYHLDNAPFVAFLAKSAKKAGIAHVDMTIDAVVRAPDGGVRSVRSADGRELSFDLFVDATGFRSLLCGGELGSPFESWASSLFCDRAIVATVPQPGAIRPYTTAETMNAGWCWRIPVRGEDHRGYVFSSSFLSDDEAAAEMRAKNPGLGEPWMVRFRSGRHRDFWRHNVAAVGNAYGFVEPLESTALHMVIVELAYLLAGIAATDDPSDDGTFPSFASDAVGAHWDYLRWFLAVHYRYNHRIDSRFWRAVREDVDVSGFDALLARFSAEGPWLDRRGRGHEVGDAVFGYRGLMMMLLGQKVPSPMPTPGIGRDVWAARTASQRALAASALPQSEALSLLDENPELIRAFAEAPGSWCRGDGERVGLPPRTRDVVAPRRGGLSVGASPHESLLRGATNK